MIEVLIVVVIIAILAALVIPRMLGQVTKSSAAEAIMMVNTIKRQAERTYDLTGSYPISPTQLGPMALYIGSDGAQTSFVTNFGNWASIGVQGPESSTQWSYELVSRTDHFYLFATNHDGSSIAAYFSPGNAQVGWGCSGVFSNDGDLSKPCRIA